MPTAFRHGSFMPVTGTLSLGMIWSANPPAALLCHWLYQARAAWPIVLLALSHSPPPARAVSLCGDALL